MLATEAVGAVHETRAVVSEVDPFRALELDRTLPLAPEARRDYIANLRSPSRQFLLPLARPVARSAIVANQLWKTVMPNGLTSSAFLHRRIVAGLRRFVRPDANRLVLRHFHLGSDLLAFIARNAPVEVPTTPLRPCNLEALEDHVFVQHDINLFRFVIRLNEALLATDTDMAPRRFMDLDFSPIHEDPPDLGPMPEGRANVIDVQTAIECYTPAYQALLTDDEFWRASISLQLDETIAFHICTLLDDFRMFPLVANRHPLVPESTLRAGHRLMLHGLGTEGLHGWLVGKKREQRRQRAKAGCP